MLFSALMSLYHGTRPSEIMFCLQSLCAQQLPAAQIVLVRDGPVSSEVEQCVASFASRLPFKHIFFSKNRGLGPALHDGMIACDFDIVARVDSDDFSLPERFALQTDFLRNNPEISVVGSWMVEHDRSADNLVRSIRRTPVESDKIASQARFRNPINHPTAMLRRSHVLSVGNYQPCLLFEDYFLWIRLLLAGYRLANIPSALVETEVDSAYFARRGGISYLGHELALLQKIRDIGFLSPVGSMMFILTRLPVRVLPIKLRRICYQALLRE